MKTENNLEELKIELINDLKEKQENKILEPTNVALLTKLINNADNITEAIAIAELGTTYKSTGFHFDKRLEKIGDTIKYLEKNENLSFVNNKEKLTHKLIIGDNYDTLLNLLITHKGKIDVIYIDPPYGKDSMGEFAKTNYDNNITRDNLLSMLYPRLLLAKQLLSNEGIIFISIDDKNQAHIKCLMDEIFGENNFIENFIWIKNATKNLSHTTSTNHEYIICYSKNKNIINESGFFRIKKPGYDEVMKILSDAQKHNKSIIETEVELRLFYKDHPEYKGINMYTKVEERINALGQKCLKVYRLDNISAPKSTGKAATYDVIHPITKKPCKTPSRGWGFTWDKMQEHIKNNNIYFYKDETYVPQFKRFLDTVDTEVQKSIIEDFTDGKKELIALFNESPFDNPKPTTLISCLLKLIKPNAIVLDFFAGSGTTGHAVMQLNREDGGNRQFILCTNNENTKITSNGIAYDVTSKRLKRIMSGECYDGTKDFKWLDKNEAYDDNLDVFEIIEVSNREQREGKSAFDVIDETNYGLEKFESIEEKISWICSNFDKTQKYIDSE